MRSKAPLVIIEQAIMLLVFALAAVLCLRVFIGADARSAESTRRDQALVQAQSAAEVLKSCSGDFAAAAEYWGGNWDGATWTIRFDSDWRQVQTECAYLLRVSPLASDLPYLGLARVEVFREETLLAALETAWLREGKL